MNCKTPITGSALRKSLIGASCALAVGCASLTPEQIEANRLAYQQQQEQYQASIPTCASAKECEAKWLAARRWVLDTCDFKLQHVTDDFLETYHSGDYADTNMWCRVSKTPTGETTYQLELEVGVNNPFAGGDRTYLKQTFNDAVNAAWQSAP